jgi:hypothetical protein
VARDAEGGVGGAEKGGLIKTPPKIELEVSEGLLKYLALWVVSIVGLN